MKTFLTLMATVSLAMTALTVSIRANDLESEAAQDALYAWNKFDLQQGSDHHFNWFEIGWKIAEAESVFHTSHNLSEGPLREAYDKKFNEAFSAIAYRIEAQHSLETVEETTNADKDTSVGGVKGAKREIINGQPVTVLPLPQD